MSLSFKSGSPIRANAVETITNNFSQNNILIINNLEFLSFDYKMPSLIFE